MTPVDLPVYDLRWIAASRQRLMDRVFAPRVDTSYSLSHIMGDARLICRILRVTSTSCVVDSLLHLATQAMSQATAQSVAWRLAGNVAALRRGESVQPWVQQTANEWMPVQILSATRSNAQGRPGFLYTFRIYAGSGCPAVVAAFWSKAVVGMAARQCGFSAPWGKYPYKSGLDLVGLRLWGCVTPEHSKERPGFRDICCSPAFMNWNRRNVLSLRCRVTPCPNQWDHPCRKCPVGYVECAGSIHPTTYELRHCFGCGEDAYFDVLTSNVLCVECTNSNTARNL